MSRTAPDGIFQSLTAPIQRRLILKIVFPILGMVLVCLFVWVFFHTAYKQQLNREQLLAEADRIGDTIKLGLHYSMLLNSREDIRSIVENYGKLDAIADIRILNKQGEVMFSSRETPEPQKLSKSAPLCQTCHRSAKPPLSPPLEHRIYQSATGGKAVPPPARQTLQSDTLSLVSPIPNEPGCSANTSCHFHSPEEKILGVLDFTFDIAGSERAITEFRRHTIYLAALLFAGLSVTLVLLSSVLITRPIRRITRVARALGRGETPPALNPASGDEMDELAHTVHVMGRELVAKNDLLELQMNHYLDLFEGVPCFITVQDRDYRLLRYNRAFGQRFSAAVGEFCFKAYKNRDEPCPDCPVEKTFSTGHSQTTEESGYYKDGSRAHWIVRTAPIMDTEGRIVAAMEMCLDITQRKELESELKLSEMKYCDIFNNIPSSVFMLDAEDMSIIDCNKSATIMYGYTKEELLGMPFQHLFTEGQRSGSLYTILSGRDMDQVRHVDKEGRKFYVSLNASPSSFAGKDAFLVTTTDITARLETEQQLIQAGKMATLGEMATGVAHEINQPLSVIQTSVDLIRRRLEREQSPEPEFLGKLTGMIEAQIQRATKIINHLREFGRKPEMELEVVNLNEVILRAFELFSQQLVLRSIEVVWDLDQRLPPVYCERNRMEQVFINTLINARDAIEERVEKFQSGTEKKIIIKTLHNQGFVTVRIGDTGMGVPPQILNRIFEPFFTTKQVGKGTGLGLSISYGIVKDYGGSIHVSNNEYGGASFHIRLPVAGTRA